MPSGPPACTAGRWRGARHDLDPGPLARTPWTAAKARLEPVAAVRADNLPAWLEAGVAEWSQRPVIWLSASNPVTGTLASPPPAMDMPARLRAIAGAARGAHSLHEQGQLHGAICPQAVALVTKSEDGTFFSPLALSGDPAGGTGDGGTGDGAREPGARGDREELQSSHLLRWATASARSHRWGTRLLPIWIPNC